jgi:hypothetical protein
MPLAKIHVVEGRYDEDRIAKVSGAVQAALMNTLRVPPEDFYQLTAYHCGRDGGGITVLVPGDTAHPQSSAQNRTDSIRRRVDAARVRPRRPRLHSQSDRSRKLDRFWHLGGARFARSQIGRRK